MTETVTLEELQWEGVGWGKLTDEQRIAVLEDRLAQSAWGILEMTNDQIKAAQVLLNKYRGDKKAVEITGPKGQPIQFVLARSDAEL